MTIKSTVASKNPAYVFGNEHDMCVFTNEGSTNEATAVSSKLKDEFGFRNLPTNGVWTGCHELALKHVTKGSTVIENFEELGLKCSGLSVGFLGGNNCEHPEWLVPPMKPAPISLPQVFAPPTVSVPKCIPMTGKPCPCPAGTERTWNGFVPGPCVSKFPVQIPKFKVSPTPPRGDPARTTRQLVTLGGALAGAGAGYAWKGWWGMAGLSAVGGIVGWVAAWYAQTGGRITM